MHKLGDAIGYCLDLMNKMLWYLINLRWNLIKYIQFDGFINDVMFYFYLVAVMVGITGLTGCSYFRKMMSHVFRVSVCLSLS